MGGAFQPMSIDWARFKAEIGLTDEIETSAPNHVEIAAPNKNFYIAPSVIAGSGTFAAESFPAETMIGPAWIKGARTELGCMGNHSVNPTAKMVVLGTDVWLMTKTEVAKSAELTTNYRETMASVPVSMLRSH